MNLTQMRSSARLLLQDTTGTRWPDAELDQYANEAQDEFLLRTGLLEVTETLAVDGTATPANSTYTIPSNCLKLKRIAYRGRPLTERPVEFYDWEDWNTETGEPTGFYWADARKVRIVPYQAATLLATFTRTATTLAAATDTPETPTPYHPFLVHGMVARAYAKNGSSTADPAKVAQHQAEFDKGVMLALSHRPTPVYEVPYRRL